jgi:type I restriction enzyme S subunit
MMTGDPDSPPIDIRPQDWAILRTLLRQYLPQHEVWAFGERAALAEALTESDLPWTVDLLDWATTSPAFRRLIEAEHRRLQVRAPS